MITDRADVAVKGVVRKQQSLFWGSDAALVFSRKAVAAMRALVIALLPDLPQPRGMGPMILGDTYILHIDRYSEETKLPFIHIGDDVNVPIDEELASAAWSRRTHRRRH
jgi:hypothetical protein